METKIGSRRFILAEGDAKSVELVIEKRPDEVEPTIGPVSSGTGQPAGANLVAPQAPGKTRGRAEAFSDRLGFGQLSWLSWLSWLAALVRATS